MARYISLFMITALMAACSAPSERGWVTKSSCDEPADGTPVQLCGEISTDRATYAFKDPVKIRFTARNIRDEVARDVEGLAASFALTLQGAETGVPMAALNRAL